LALAIGANVAIFSFIDRALLHPLPYRDPDQLVKLWDARQSQIDSRFEASYPDYLDWKQQSQAFSSLAAYSSGGSRILAGASGPEIIPVGPVSDNFFQTLGVSPILGRVFLNGEDLASSPRYTVLTYGFWQRRFGGRQDIIGQSLTLSGEHTTIIGVLPKDFQFAPRGDVDLYVTLHATDGMLTRRNLHWIHPFGRLKPDVSVQQAQIMMNALAANLEKQYPDSNKELRTVVIPLAELITGPIKPILTVLMGAVGMLLLIGCANIANLLLARSMTRAKEIALRSALGAGRSRVIRQLITEGVVLAAAGTAAGVVVAVVATRWMVDALPAAIRQSMPYLKHADVEPRILVFAIGLTLLTALLFSLPPALRLANPVLNDALQEGGRLSGGSSWRRVGSSLVVAEVAISAILLVGSGLLLKSLFRLLNINAGFNVSQLTTFYVFPDNKRYDLDEAAIVMERNLIDALVAVPGVSAVGSTSTPPVAGGNTSLFRVVGAPMTPRPYEANSRTVDPGYFSTLQATLRAGRYFDESDSATAPQVVIINETLAKMAFGIEDPLGRQIVFTYNAQQKPRQVIGIIQDVHEGALDVEDKPAVYTPFAQDPSNVFAVVVRSTVNPASLRSALEKSVHDIDPGIILYQMQTMEDLIAQSPVAALHRYPAWLVSVFALTALLLAVVGLYGIVSYSVSQRTREIGIRIALGASRHNVLKLILGDGARLAAIGIMGGVIGAVLAGYLLRSLLFGIDPWDAATLLVVAVILSGACLFASYLPARRAARLDPMNALHRE
jgi:predicted permease